MRPQQQKGTKVKGRKGTLPLGNPSFVVSCEHQVSAQSPLTCCSTNMAAAGSSRTQMKPGRARLRIGQWGGKDWCWALLKCPRRHMSLFLSEITLYRLGFAKQRGSWILFPAFAALVSSFTSRPFNLQKPDESSMGPNRGPNRSVEVRGSMAGCPGATNEQGRKRFNRF